MARLGHGAHIAAAGVFRKWLLPHLHVAADTSTSNSTSTNTSTSTSTSNIRTCNTKSRGSWKRLLLALG